MKIAILTREYPPDSVWGGVATGYYRLARGLAVKGHDVHVICQALGKPKDYEENKVAIHRVGTNWQRYSATGRINFTYHAWKKLNRLIKENGIDIVEAPYWSAEAIFYSFSKKTPLIIRSQSSAHESIQSGTYAGWGELLKLKILAGVADFTARRADKIVADSQINYDVVKKRLTIPDAKIAVVYPATDIEVFKPVSSKIRDEMRISKDVPIVLSVGRLESKKGTHLLSQAIPDILRKAPGSKFVFVGRDTNSAPGGGSVKEHLLQQAREFGFGDNLMFFDFIEENKLVEWYSACDLYVMPSLEESFGAVIIEAMACGKPVVASATGIAPELNQLHLNGLKTVPAGNAPELAGAIINMLSLSEGNKSKIAEENRKIVREKFSVGIWVDTMTEVYREVLEKKQS